MRKWLKILLWSLLPIGLVVGGIVANKVHQNRLVKGLNIEIAYEDGTENNRFITIADLNKFIRKRHDKIESKKLNEISIEKLEKELISIPYIKTADVYTSMNAEIQVRVKQRKAIVRVYDQLNDEYYLDSEGQIMPTRLSYPAKVLICNGLIPSIGYMHKKLNPHQLDSLVQHSILKDVYLMASYIEADTLLSVQIAQMYIDAKGEFALVPLVGNHVISFGKAVDIDEKFNKLKLFYQEGLGHHRWNNYKEINLKYKNQIVCTKI